VEFRPKLGEGWTLTASAAPGLSTAPLKQNGVETNPVPVVVTPLSVIEEIEPNDTPKTATRITLPSGVNGRIGQKRDLDHFAFHAKKGQAIRFEVHARRFGTVLRSQLDSQIDVMTPEGRILASNDDLNGKDAGLVFTSPADGEYVILTDEDFQKADVAKTRAIQILDFVQET
jgi:hypothetical protein